MVSAKARRRIAVHGGSLLLLLWAGPVRADEPAAPPRGTVNAPGPGTTAPAPTSAPSTLATADVATPPVPTAPPADGDEVVRAAARKLAEEGLALFDRGEYEGALERFERAGAVVRAPTMSLMAARSLEKLGRLVDASERYLAATKMQLDASASDAFRAAQQDAVKERAALLKRIPSITIVLDAAPTGVAVTVTLDGKPVAPALVGTAMHVDPGQHTVTVSHGGTSTTQRATLAVGEARRLRFAVEVPRAPSSGGGPATAGWVGVAIGGAGLVVGAVTGGLAIAAQGRLDQAGCVEMVCPPAVQGDVDQYNALRTASGASFIAGGVVAAAGALVVGLSFRGSEPSRQAAWQIWTSPAGAGARVRF